jgi:hypothetical protein
MVKVFSALDRILVPGAKVHYEGGTGRDYDRASISVHNVAGMVIIQERTDGTNAVVYSIVTAYPGYPKGAQIGTLI